MRRAGEEHRLEIWEMPVDGRALHACLGGDPLDRRAGRTDGPVQLYGCLGDLAACVGFLLGAATLAVGPSRRGLFTAHSCLANIDMPPGRCY
jgi:hypothetical protein